MPGPQQLTYDEIVDGLAKLGHRISRSQVFRYRAQLRDDLERVRTAQIRAEAVMATVPPGSTVEEGTRRLIESVIMEAFLDAPTVQVQSITDLGKLTLAHARIGRSSLWREQWESKKGPADTGRGETVEGRGSGRPRRGP